MSVFDADRKAGCSVGVALTVTDENGQKISEAPYEWHGFERFLANQMAMDVSNAIEGIIEKYRELKGEHEKVKSQKAPSPQTR